MNVGGHEYKELNISNVDFENQPTIIFSNIIESILICSDSLTDTIWFSLNGRDIAGKLSWEDECLAVSNAEIGKVWFKTDNPLGTKVRVFSGA